MIDLAAVRSLGFRTELMLLGWQGAEIRPADGYIVIRTSANPSFWWGNFLLYSRPPQPAEPARWLADFEREFPDRGHVAIGVDVADGLADRHSTDALAETADEWEALGMTIERSAVMTAERTVPPPRPNSDAEYRPFMSDRDWESGIELAWAQVPDSDRDGPAREFAERRMAGLRRLHDESRGVWFGAFLDGVLASSLGVFTDGTGLARYQNVDTHPDYRNRGLAGTLVHYAADHARARIGVERLVIVADPDHVAYRIYERLGFRTVETQYQLAKSPGPE
jgi:RimJ/RimL family protein N-acetyltransferase